MIKKFIVMFGVIALIFVIGFNILNANSDTEHQPITEELIRILEVKPELKVALEESIRKANRLDTPTLDAYYDFLDETVTLIPTSRNILPKILEFYYLIDLSPGGILQKDDSFQQWTLKFAKDWGKFLDTTESAKGLETFYTDPDYHIDDYMVAPSGWLTYNQFFARHVKPGKRPIDGLCDDSIIVSPADSVFHGHWKIDKNSEIAVKGLKWSVSKLLEGSPFKDRFRGGTYMHAFLNVNDYHRYHVPVGGKVLEARKIPGKVVLDVIRKEDGSLDVIDGDTYQFSQDRGLIVIESPIGLVAVLPIGMAQVSSANISAEVGSTLAKGEEFGYFLFGGSDIIVIFERDIKVKITADIGTHYNQGKKIAIVVK
ncbi:MAG: phosphatidylserine decarboxylase [Candidatus Omnitrophota bacterium]|nr:MAG: phosphatidylserine decarboxylase [Candidatus Omnitrophota bacterium]